MSLELTNWASKRHFYLMMETNFELHTTERSQKCSPTSREIIKNHQYSTETIRYGDDGQVNVKEYNSRNEVRIKQQIGT